MAAEKALSLTAEPWSEQAGRVLQPALFDALGEIKTEVQNKQATLWRCQGEKTEGYLITRAEGGELVLIAGAGVGARPVLQLIQTVAKREGFKTIRTHVKNFRLCNLYERMGWSLTEQVYTVDL